MIYWATSPPWTSHCQNPKPRQRNKQDHIPWDRAKTNPLTSLSGPNCPFRNVRWNIVSPQICHKYKLFQVPYYIICWLVIQCLFLFLSHPLMTHFKANPLHNIGREPAGQVLQVWQFCPSFNNYVLCLVWIFSDVFYTLYIYNHVNVIMHWAPQQSSLFFLQAPLNFQSSLPLSGPWSFSPYIIKMYIMDLSTGFWIPKMLIISK